VGVTVGGGEGWLKREKRENICCWYERENVKKEKEEGGLSFYKITPPFNVEMSKLPMVLYLCYIICVWLSFLFLYRFIFKNSNTKQILSGCYRYSTQL